MLSMEDVLEILYSTAGCYSRRSIRFTFIKTKVSLLFLIVNLMQVKHLDTVNRLLGEEHPFRFIEEEAS